MCGAGKSEIADYLMSKRNFEFLRFGQITLDRIKEMGKEPSEALEREIRERLRKEHGMAAFAILNKEKIDKLLEKGDVLGDGLYSWEEYLYLKENFQDRLQVIAVYAPPSIRYKRLSDRQKDHIADKENRYRNFTHEEAVSRDQAEIENLHKAGPIAMADITLNNTGPKEELYGQIDQLLENFEL